ncbi:PepSY domain-containing protein [Bradyrhizobium sp. Pear76]|uniref:PepSY domain-containing protein n=1 Tax=Bradyrhizobium oropedii TaxID=1571201 RepID=UPI001E64E22C|nr:PepSY domain-containing protein [Bradyrhizobium oropedii]MCC8963088.1 PepSY domain-containing protein [Bradyrhizobium oropedii]
MQKRKLFHLILALAIAGTAVPARAMTQDELVAKLQAAGYANVSDVKSTAEGITAKAMKNGKPVRLVIDSSGQIKEQD